jgi:hypothetical protein
MSSVRLVHARTSARDPGPAAEEICRQLGSVNAPLIVMFASRERDQRALNRAVRERLPRETRLLGATTGGEIDRDGMHAGTVVAAALHGDLEVGLGLGRDLSHDGVTAGETAIRNAARELGARPEDLASRKYGALVIDDGIRLCKEQLLLGVMSLNQALLAVGGGASDSEPDPAKQSAIVHVDGEIATDAVAVALFRTEAPWAAMRSHWYEPTGQMVRITKVDHTARRALEIDGQPAAQRYAALLGVGIDELEFGKPNGFAVRPTALKVGREYFIRGPWKPLDDGSILFANMLEEGSELELVQITDIVESTRRFLESELPARVPSPSAALFFHSSGRKAYAEATGRLGDLGGVFKAAPPCIGLNAHFEIHCGFQINTTLTALAFGASP